MNKKHFYRQLPIAAVFICSLGQISSAQAIPFVTNLVDGINPLPIPGNQAYGGRLGDDFTTTTAITLTSIGVFDNDGNGTNGNLFWELFNVSTGSLIYSQTISATGARTPGTAGIESNYVFEDLNSFITLSANETYSAVVYGFDSVDKNFNTNFDLNTLDVEFNTAGILSAGGRFGGLNAGFPISGLPTNGAGNEASIQQYNFGAATFKYNTPANGGTIVTEPSVLWLLGSGLLGLIGAAKRKKT